MGVFLAFGEKFDGQNPLRYHNVAGWSSLVARWAHNPKVEGSNPSPATNFFNWLRFLPAGRGKEASARYEKSMADARVRHKTEASVSNPLAIDGEEAYVRD